MDYYILYTIILIKVEMENKYKQVATEVGIWSLSNDQDGGLDIPY